MPPKPKLEFFLEDWLKRRKEPVVPEKRKPLVGPRKGQNPKWNDDTWFEKRFGDPDYYNRIKGLD